MNLKRIFCVSLLVLGLGGASRAESVDLRSEFGPVKSQGPHRNTCSAFAATALAEFEIFRATGMRVDLSPSYTYRIGRTRALDSPFLREAYRPMDGLAGYLAVRALQWGVISEADWRYDPSPQSQTTGFTGSPPDGLDSKVLPYRFAINFVPLTGLGAALLERRRPLVFNITWYSKAVDAQGDFRLPSLAEVQACRGRRENCGGHVILLVGYDTSTQRFVFRNSWGASWGNHGYGTIPAQYLTEHCETCPHLGNLDQLNADEAELVRSAASGVSATLVD